MSFLKQILIITNLVKKRFLGNLWDAKKAPSIITQDKIVELHKNASKYYDQSDVIYINELKIYAAYNYKVVNELLLSDNLGVSSMHTALNPIYFQTKEEYHAHNKRIAIKHLSFLSKKLMYVDSDYLTNVFNIVAGNLPKKTPFNLVDFLINPVILINAINDLGFIATFPIFNPNHKDFSYDYLIQKTKEIFDNRIVLEQFLIDNLSDENIPFLMNTLINELKVEGGYNKSELPLFFTTVIYTSIENVASFVTSFLFFSLNSYPDLISDKNTAKLVDLGNEILRIYSPNFVTFRTVTKTFTFKNTHLKKGELVALFIGAANLDPTEFEEPNSIKFNRKQKQIAFGRGKVSCIGQFASFRIALNFIDNLHNLSGQIHLLDSNPQFDIKGVVKISTIKAIYNDDFKN